jgi:hypothetical protein
MRPSCFPRILPFVGPAILSRLNRRSTSACTDVQLLSIEVKEVLACSVALQAALTIAAPSFTLRFR